MHKNSQVMEEKAQTWRDLLGKVTTKPGERQRIAAALRVNSITINRWIVGLTNPRVETLRALPGIVPQYREELESLLRQEYPALFNDEPITDVKVTIPSNFYNQVLNSFAMDPERLRISSLASTILQQIILQLDPNKEGFAVLITQCVAPIPGHKVRSLRIVLGYGGPPATRHLSNYSYFFGAESQAGITVLFAHPVVIQNPEDAQRITPGQHIIVQGSSLAIPLLQYDRTAGCACFISPQKNYFTPERINLLKEYANLLTIAFEDEEFYPLSDINLAMMPSRAQQETILYHLQDRITARMLLPMAKGQPISRTQAEKEVIKEVETELIQSILTPEHHAEVSIS